jgi:hypothetical protein
MPLHMASDPPLRLGQTIMGDVRYELLLQAAEPFFSHVQEKSNRVSPMTSREYRPLEQIPV